MGKGTKLYVNMDAKDPHTLCGPVIESARENRKLRETEDKIRQKAIKFVHGEQWDPAVEQERAQIGLQSLVADRTLPVYKTLDAFARKNRNDVQFAPIGDKNFSRAKLQDAVYVGIRTATELHSHYTEALGNAAITDEAYLYLYPQKNVLDQVWPRYYVPGAFEVYPDVNSKDRIRMGDARFVDLWRWKTVDEVKEELEEFGDPAFLKLLEGYTPGEAAEEDLTNNQGKDRSADDRWERNGEIMVLYRFFKRKVAISTLVDMQTGEERVLEEEEAEYTTPEVAATMGRRIDTQREEMLWYCVAVPAVSEERFAVFEQAQFQPIDPLTMKKRWPIVRLPYQWIQGKAIGAIRPVIKLQEARNQYLSAFLHHVQTAANGALMYDKRMFNGDQTAETEFKEKRNQAGNSIPFTKPPDATLSDLLFPVPKGEFAFGDGGTFLEQIINEAVTENSGAQPVLRGESEKGGPASLFKQQVEKASDSLIGVGENFRDFQFAVADLLCSFVRQFWREEMILEMQGDLGQAQPLVLNEMSPAGELLNDVSQGLFAVRKIESATNETARRQRLGDSIEVLKALIDIQLPNFLMDYAAVIENLEIPQERKQRFLQEVEQWKALNGVGFQAQQQQQQATADQAMLAAQPQVPQPQPLQPAR